MNPAKLLRTSVLFAATACVASAEFPVSAQAWLETYYLNPEPGAVVARVKALSRDGFFERPGNAAIGIGFLATLFNRHPDRIEGWLNELERLPAAHQRLLAAALWQAGHDAAPDVLRIMSADSPVRQEVMRLVDIPAPLIVDTPVRSVSSLNLQWGAFLASGDERHIGRMMEALGTNDRGLHGAAEVAFARMVAEHPRVQEIYRAQIRLQPAEARAVLEAILASATPSA
jgi:hypothetical protein